MAMVMTMLKNKNENSTVMACFTPPVMVATFLIEIGMAIYTVIRYKWDSLTRIVAAMLVLLGVFQLAEYSICEGLGLTSEIWSKIGFAAITALPPLGIHMIATVARRPVAPLVVAAYGTGLVWLLLFITQDLFKGFGCGGNYVIFSLEEGWDVFYGAYYYFWLLAAVAVGINYWATLKNKYQRKALFWGAAGYLSFILPTSIITIINPSTSAGIPSIMCGFAIILAVLLVVMVLPNYRKSLKR